MTKDELLSKYKNNNYSVDTELTNRIRESSSRNPVAESLQKPANPNNATFLSKPDDNPIEAGLKSAGNVPSSAVNLGVNITEAALHPVETVKGIFNAIVGGGGKLRDKLAEGIDTLTHSKVGSTALGAGQTNEQATQTFEALQNSLIERYGSLEAAQKTATEDPVGFGSDVVGILTATGQLGKLNAITDASKAKLAETVAPKVDAAALTQMQKAIELNPTDIRRIKKPNVAGKDPAEWLLEKGFKGSQDSIISDLDEFWTNSKSEVDAGLKEIDVRIPAEEAVSAQNTLKVLKDTFEGTIGNEKLVERIDAELAKPDYSLDELNEIKRLADNELSIFKTTGDIKQGATARGLFNVRDELKTLIEDKAAENGFDNVRDLNKDTQVAYEISESMKKRLDVKSKLPELGLRDGILAVGGFATGGALTAVGAVVAKKVIESAAFRTHLAQILKSLTKEKKAELNDALKNRNYEVITSFLIPLVNEFENSQEEDPLEEKTQ